MQLRKLTTRYIVEEDRFRVSAEADGSTINLWLTQRLILDLIPHLLRWLDAHTPEQPPRQAEASEPAEDSAGHPEADSGGGLTPQVTSQLVSQIRPAVASVDAGKARRSVLVKTIHFQPRDGVLRLVFPLPDEEAELLLQPEHLRIWLGAFYTGWQQARWPDIWPDWMKQAHRIRQQYPARTMH